MLKAAYILTLAVISTVNIGMHVHADPLLAYVEPKPYYTGPGSETDDDLQRKIQHKIYTGWFAKDFARVRVQVRDGLVILKGSVRTDEDKKRLVDAILGINGVGHVDTQVEVEEPSKRH